MLWFHSVHNFGLGNTINCMAAIKWLANDYGQRIPCCFDLPFVRDAFLDCPFIEILDKKPSTAPLFTSELTNTSHNTRPDFQYIFEKVTGQRWNGERCYIDRPKEEHAVKYAVFVHGSGNEEQNYLNTKQIPDKYFEAAIKACWAKNIAPVFVGSRKDLNRNKWAEIYACGIDDIRRALALINGAEFVIGNDTGLIHAAGAMDKKTFVFWKDTQLPRCMNSGTDCTYLMKGNWGLIGELLG